MSEAFEKAKKALSIKSVTLSRSYVALNDEVDPDIDASIAEIQGFRGVKKVKETSIESEEGSFWEYHFFYTCGLRLVEDSVEETDQPENDAEAVVEIKATFIARYVADVKIEKSMIEAFSQDNVGYHVWPYWRELVQSSCSRLDIAPIETPFYFVSTAC